MSLTLRAHRVHVFLRQKQEKNKDVIIGPTKEELIQKLKEFNNALKTEQDIFENNTGKFWFA